MPSYRINTNHNGRHWVATFDDYDGAPDTPADGCLMGTASEEIDAIVDLLTDAEDLATHDRSK